MTFGLLMNVIGGLGIFLLGMKNMSEGMQAIAGPTMRKMINRATSNRFMGVGMGTLVTCLVQSSSITTVMVVGLVNVNMMNIAQAFGVIMGANIGTTITGWILVLKIGKYGLWIVGPAVLVYLFSKRDRVRYIAMAFIGLGLVFFGLELMKNGFKPLRGDDAFQAWFVKFAYDGSYFSVLKCAAVGAVLTMIVQSSSATLGITIGLAVTGVIDYPTAAALVLGENIGTTITAYLASVGGSVNARRASYSHIMFNLLGVLWITALFTPYIALITQYIEWSTGGLPDAVGMVTNDEGVKVQERIHVAAAIAATHTGFNLANVLFFLPLVGQMSKLLMWIVPDPEKKGVAHLQYFDIGLVDTPGLGLDQSKQEIQLMGAGCSKMMTHLRPFIENPTEDEAVEKKIFHREEVLDVVQKEINEFIGHLMAGNVTLEVMEEGRSQIRMADEYESISDYIMTIMKLNIKLRKEDMEISQTHRTELLDLHDHVMDYLTLINEAVKTGSTEVVSKARSQGETISHLMKQYRSNHLERVGTEQTSPLESLTITDILNAYRRIKDHALNIAEVLSGDK
jgi:phosphate:Na+ symporter